METIFDVIKKKPKLFVNEISHKQGTVIQVLKRHCLGYENRKPAQFLIEEANKLLAYGKIEDSSELRAIVKDLRNNETFLRIIGSIGSGYWLALATDEKDANAMNINRAKSALETCVKNGVGIKLFYTFLNELKEKHYPADNQTRHQINSEKKIIKRYSDDLLKEGESE